MEKDIPLKLAELKARRQSFMNDLNGSAKNLTAPDRIALWITDKIGSMSFFAIVFLWTGLWLGWNFLAPRNLRFDPYPAFVLWLFISNMIQLFLMPLIM